MSKDKELLKGKDEVEIKEIPVNEIYLSEIDQTFNDTRDIQIKDLALSIESEGLLHPIIVIDNPTTNGRYELISGRRRLKAYKYLQDNTSDPNKFAFIKATVYPQSTSQNFVQRMILKLIENKERVDLTILEKHKLIEDLLQQYQKIAEQQQKNLDNIDISTNIEEILDKTLSQFNMTRESFKYIKQIEGDLKKIKALEEKQKKVPVLSKAIEDHLNMFNNPQKTQKFIKSLDINIPSSGKDKEKLKVVHNKTMSPVFDEYIKTHPQYIMIETLKNMIISLPWEEQNQIITKWGTEFERNHGNKVLSPLFLCNVDNLIAALKSKKPRTKIFTEWTNLTKKELFDVINQALGHIYAKSNQSWLLQSKISDFLHLMNTALKSSQYQEVSKIEKLDFCLSLINIIFYFIMESLQSVLKDFNTMNIVIDGSLEKRINILQEKCDSLQDIEFLLNQDFYKKHILQDKSKGNDQKIYKNLEKIKEQIVVFSSFLSNVIDTNTQEMDIEKVLQKMIEHIVKFSDDDDKIFIDVNVDVSLQRMRKVFAWWYSQAITSKNIKNKNKILEELLSFIVYCQQVLDKQAKNDLEKIKGE